MFRRDDDVYFHETLVGDEIHKFRFDYARYMEFYGIRKKDSLDRDTFKINGHPMVGMVFEAADGKNIIIESVHKHWHFGYYEMALYRTIGTQSHGTIVVKNISSVDDSIIEMEQKFNSFKAVQAL